MKLITAAGYGTSRLLCVCLPTSAHHMWLASIFNIADTRLLISQGMAM